MEISAEEWPDKRQEVRKAVLGAEVIAMDFEFTGFADSDAGKMQWHDDQETRYAKARYTATHFQPIQIGVSCWNWQKDAYVAKTYNIYLCPDKACFFSEVDALRFLRNHKFDFNKWISAALVSKLLTSSALCSDSGQISIASASRGSARRKYVLRASFLKERNVGAQLKFREAETIMKQVVNWQAKGAAGAPADQKPLELNIKNYAIRYAVYARSRDAFGGRVFINFSRTNSHMTIKHGKELKKQPKEEDKKQTEPVPVPPPPVPVAKQDQEKKEQLKEEKPNVLGFSEVVEWMVQAQAPLVVHNGFYDLAFLYQHFIGEMPGTFAEYACELRKLFPGGIYDTKFIQQHFFWIYANNLAALYKVLETNATVKDQLKLRHGEEFKRYLDLSLAHEAGYDAFITGAAFIRMVKAMEIDSHFHEQKKQNMKDLEEQMEKLSLQEKKQQQQEGGGKKQQPQKKPYIYKKLFNTPLQMQWAGAQRNKVALNPAMKQAFDFNEGAGTVGHEIGHLIHVEMNAPGLPPSCLEASLKEAADYTVKKIGERAMLVELQHAHESMDEILARLNGASMVVTAARLADIKKFTFHKKIGG